MSFSEWRFQLPVSWSSPLKKLATEISTPENLRNAFLGVVISVASFLEWRISVMKFLRVVISVASSTPRKSWCGESP